MRRHVGLPLWIVGGLVGLLLAGCASSRLSPSDVSSGDAPASWAARYVEHTLRSTAASWNGVPYVWGGTSRRGVDCSGFVQTVYRTAFRTALPRTTAAQARIGTDVAPRSLRPGDLVFFAPRRGRWHAGIYLSDGQFVHASTSEGVTMSSLQTAYWQRRWSHARRVLPTLHVSPRAASPSAPPRAAW
jgi:cell wall-associated NlpC family hydrolase